MDVEINGQMGMYTVRPISQQAKDWVNTNVETESWQWMGNAFCVDSTGMTENITFGMIDAGFEVYLNGQKCFKGVGELEGTIIFHPNQPSQN